jgi:ankyrin repeat protein
MTKDQSRRSIVVATSILLLSLAGLTFGAGKSDVADAVMRGDKAAVTRLLAQKADVNASQLDGTTAVHWAVFNDDIATLDSLIAAGANIKAVSRGGCDAAVSCIIVWKHFHGDPATESRR